MLGLLSRFHSQVTSIRLDRVKLYAAQPQKLNFELRLKSVAETVRFTNRLELVVITGQAIDFSGHWILELQNNR